MKLKGKAASSGIAIARAYKLEQPELFIARRDLALGEEEKEAQKFKKAIASSILELQALYERTKEKMGEDKASIFSGHLLILEDPEIITQTLAAIEGERDNASYAFDKVTKSIISLFESMEDDYMRERAADIRDVARRVLFHIKGYKIPDLTLINEPVILVANDLTPSETAQLDKTYIKGFATNIGGRTSHSAIMARSMGIPAVTGLGDITLKCFEGDSLIIDGSSGYVIVRPSTKELTHYQNELKQQAEQAAYLNSLIPLPCITKDGHPFILEGNIGSPLDLPPVLHNNAHGIGLFRSEFLYMDSMHLPSEEMQYEAYKTVLEQMGGKMVVIRTLDIGGDKELPYLQFPKEMNPFLGYRAIRLCLDRVDIFTTQLRALLRASIHGQLAIMFPMIATLDEFRQAKAHVLRVKEELHKEGFQVSDKIQIGVMIEIPAAALIADLLAKEADFFSIGTNDLIQYTMAADRMSEKVSYLYQPLNPSVLKLIKLTIDGAHRHGKWAAMCGEVAGDPLATPILLGLGLDAFSMSSSSLMTIKSVLLNLRKDECVELANKALELGTHEEIEQLVKGFWNNIMLGE